LFQLVRPAITAKALKRKDYTMTDNQRSRRDKEFALFLARNHARNHGKSQPDLSNISPIGFTRVKPTMSREEIKRNLIEAFRRNGITVKPGPDQEDTDQL
jgi:hypothetical protein